MTHPEHDSVESHVETGTDAGEELTSEALVEEVSIDGMCGVY